MAIFLPGNGVHKYSGKTVDEILKAKKASIKYGSLDPGSPTWDDISHLSWEEIVQRAKRRQTGYKTIKKLLTVREYDK
jgi:hypothetical protein